MRRASTAPHVLPVLLVLGLLIASMVVLLSVDRRTDAGPKPVPAAQVPSRAPTIALTDYGGRCDGHTDDREAFVAALSYLGGRGGGTLDLPVGECEVEQTVTSPYLVVPPGVTVRGRGPRSVVVLTCESPSSYVQLFRLEGSAVALRDVRLTRGADCYGDMVAIHQTNGLTLDHVTIDGGSHAFAQTVDGIVLQGYEGPSSGYLLDAVELRNLEYGLFQPNDVPYPVIGVTVRDSLFEDNRADDLEFNAPVGSMQDVSVLDSTFRDNRASADGAGFGIGLANVQVARVEGASFSGYQFEPVHIEDRSAHIAIVGNRFARSFTTARPWSSAVFIVNDAHDVTIAHNSFDLSANTNPIQAVWVNAGGPGFEPPDHITVEDNRITGGSAVIYAEGIDSVVVRGNRLTPAS